MKGRLLLFSMLVLLLVVSPMVASCAPTKVTPKEVTPTTTATKPEGTVVIRQPEAREEQFIPWVGMSNEQIWDIVYDYPIYIKADMTLVGGLAKRWEESADSLTVTLWLREGIPWQDGLGPGGSNSGKWGEVTTEDVKYTYDKYMAPSSTGGRAAILRDSIKSIEIVDRYTIVFHLKAPDPVWWLYLTDVGGGMQPIVCKKYIETVGDTEAGKNPVGSGPYRLVEHRFGDYLKFEALDEHWRVVPEFKYLIIKIVPEDSTAIAMLKTGVIDVTQVTSAEVAEVKKAGFRTSTSSGGYAAFLDFGGMIVPQDSRYVAGYHQMDPWKDIRVREAMSIAIDREAIVKAFYAGIGIPMPVIFPMPGWEKLKPIPYDPVRAKQLLAEAGFPNGFSFRLLTWFSSPGAELPKVAEVVAGYWEEIGIKPTIFLTDTATYLPKSYSCRTAGDVSTARLGFKQDWTLYIIKYFSINGQMPYFESAELQGLIERLTPEVNWDKRNEIWGEIGRYMRDNYVEVPLVNVNTAYAISGKVEKLQPIVSGLLPNYAYIRHAQPLNMFRLFELE